MFFPGAALYMEKIAVGPEAIDAIDIEASPTDNVRAVAEAKGVAPRQLSVVVLERERHADLIAELRDAGAKVNLIRDGDVAPSIAAAQGGTGVDMLYGIGGTPEGVISAAALSAWAAGSRRGSGRATTTSGGGSSKPASIPRACSRPTTSSPARTSSSRRPA